MIKVWKIQDTTDESYPILLRMFTFCLNLYFRVYHRPAAVSLAMAVISDSSGTLDSGYGSLEEQEEETEERSQDVNPQITDSEKRHSVPSSCPLNAKRILCEESNNEDIIENEEVESFKQYLKRVQECLAGRSKDDSMERLDPIIISVYKS